MAVLQKRNIGEKIYIHRDELAKLLQFLFHHLQANSSKITELDTLQLEGANDINGHPMEG